MKKHSKTSSTQGKQMYQDPNEAQKHLWFQGQDFRRYANEILNSLPVKTGKLLDVGCGFGWVVAEAKKRGFDATGIDEAKPYITLGMKVLKVNLILSSLENYSPKDKFDIVVLNHVLEHIKEPEKFLAKIRRLLKINGILFVACPNIASLMFWIFKNQWYGLQPAQHIWQFTGKSLPNLIKKNGFEIDRVIINSLDYKPVGWKKFAFFLLTNAANIAGIGDQVIVLAKKK